MSELPQNPTGRPIEGYEVLGEERDASQRVVGADVLLKVGQPVGRFALNIVVASHLVDEAVHTALTLGDEEPDAFAHDPLEQKLPFVVNDEVITPDVLDRELTGTIGPDLARALWPVGSHEDVR